MTDDIQLDPIPEGKIYKIMAIQIATFFGGVFVGAYMLAENFKTLGNPRAARITWVGAIVLFVGILCFSLLPVLSNLPVIAYPVLYAIIAAAVGRNAQLAGINAHIERGGEVHSTGRIVIVTLIGLGITVFMALALFFIEDNLLGRF